MLKHGCEWSERPVKCGITYPHYRAQSVQIPPTFCGTLKL